jgi:hypothetical protein
MSPTESANAWDRFVHKIGLLTLAMGLLEAAIMAMHCKATAQHEGQLKSRLNRAQRDGLLNAVKLLGWPDDKLANLTKRLSEIDELDKRRNRFVHISAGIVSDDSIPGVPAGAVIDVRTYGIGVTSTNGKSWNIGVLGKKIDLEEIDKLTADIHQARLGLVPFMELVDAIKHPPLSPPEFIKRLKKGVLLS